MTDFGAQSMGDEAESLWEAEWDALPDGLNAYTRAKRAGVSAVRIALSRLQPQAPAGDVALRQALAPFADAGEYLDLETDGFLGGERLSLYHVDHELFDGLKFSDFVRAKETLASAHPTPEAAGPLADEARGAFSAIQQHLADYGGCDDSPDGMRLEAEAKAGLETLQRSFGVLRNVGVAALALCHGATDDCRNERKVFVDPEDFDALSAALDRLEAANLIERLAAAPIQEQGWREALKPFALWGDYCDEGHYGQLRDDEQLFGTVRPSDGASITITVGDLRRARAALNPQPNSGGGIAADKSHLSFDQTDGDRGVQGGAHHPGAALPSPGCAADDWGHQSVGRDGASA